MIYPNPGYQAYQKNKYETASPHRLILFLYEGAIRSCTQVVKAIQQSDVKATYTHITRTQDIINELIACLDLDKGGEIAANLQNLYDYMNGRLLQANLNRDPEPAQEVIGLLTSIKSAWEEIGKEVSLGAQSG